MGREKETIVMQGLDRAFIILGWILSVLFNGDKETIVLQGLNEALIILGWILSLLFND